MDCVCSAIVGRRGGGAYEDSHRGRGDRAFVTGLGDRYHGGMRSAGALLDPLGSLEIGRRRS